MFRIGDALLLYNPSLSLSLSLDNLLEKIGNANMSVFNI